MPGKVREIVITSPSAGYVTRYDFQQQPPYSTPGSKNFWPVDAKTGRRRASFRPRLALYKAVDSTHAVRGLAQVNVATQQTLDRGLFAFANGGVYRYAAGSFGSEGSSQTDTGRAITATPYLQKLYIAGKASGTPKVYDCVGDTIGDIVISPGTGSALDGATLVCTWNDCLVWSGVSTAPHAWYMSRQGDPLDYEFGLADTDVTAAVDGTNLDGGNIGEKITALIPHNRECLIFGATDSMHIMRGHPRQGGRLEVLSHVVGPLTNQAWCKTGDDHTVFLTRNGLYVMPPGCGAAPSQLSKQRIPDSLMGIDTSTYSAFLGYDARFDGILICITETAGASSGRQAFWLDWEEGSYWPLEFSTTEQPLSMMRFDPLDGNNVSGLLLGGSGGGTRRFDRTDVGSIDSAYLYIGPIKLSPTPFHKGIIQRITAKFGSNTTDVTGVVSIYCANSGEAAYDAAVADTDDWKWSAVIEDFQNNHLLYPRVGGHAAVIKIAMEDGAEYQSFEQMTLSVMDAGVAR